MARCCTQKTRSSRIMVRCGWIFLLLWTSLCCFLRGKPLSGRSTHVPKVLGKDSSTITGKRRLLVGLPILRLSSAIWNSHGPPQFKEVHTSIVDFKFLPMIITWQYITFFFCPIPSHSFLYCHLCFQYLSAISFQ